MSTIAPKGLVLVDLPCVLGWHRDRGRVRTRLVQYGHDTPSAALSWVDPMASATCRVLKQHRGPTELTVTGSVPILRPIFTIIDMAMRDPPYRHFDSPCLVVRFTVGVGEFGQTWFLKIYVPSKCCSQGPALLSATMQKTGSPKLPSAHAHMQAIRGCGFEYYPC